jgi:hypothetical protein
MVRIIALSSCLMLTVGSVTVAQELTAHDSGAPYVGAHGQPGKLLRSALSQSLETPLRAETVRPPLQDTRRYEGNWLERHPALAGALIGFGVGFGLTYAASDGDDDRTMNVIDPFGPALVWGGASAGAGALIGWGIGRNRNDDDPDYLRSPSIR